MKTNLASLLEQKKYEEIATRAAASSPPEFQDNDLMVIAEAMTALGRQKEAAQAYLVVVTRGNARSVEAAMNVLTRRLINYDSPITREIKQYTLAGIKNSGLAWTEALLRHVINIDLEFYEQLLWEYLKLPQSSALFAIRLMIYGGVAHLSKYKNQFEARDLPRAYGQLLELAKSYSNGNYVKAAALINEIDRDCLCEGSLDEFLVLEAATHFAQGKYEHVIDDSRREGLTIRTANRLAILAANAEFARGNRRTAHSLRWVNQVTRPQEHLGIRNLTEAAFLRDCPCIAQHVVLLADEGLGDTVYYLSKFARHLEKSPQFLELAVEERHLTVTRNLLRDLGVRMDVVSKSKIIGSSVDGKTYRYPIAFLSNLPHLMAGVEPEWFKQLGPNGYPTGTKQVQVTENEGHSKLNVVLSLKTSRRRNKAEREISVPEILDVLLSKNQCEIITLDDDDDYPNSVRRLPQSAYNHPELAYRAIASADVYVGICSTYIYMAGILGVRSFCLLPPSPRDIWLDGGRLTSPYASVEFSKKTFETGWLNALESLDSWIKKATP